MQHNATSTGQWTAKIITVEEVEAFATQLVEMDADADWEMGEQIRSIESSWRPTAVVKGSKRILQVCLTSKVPSHIRRRILSAIQNGYEVNLVIRLMSLYDPEEVEFLSVSGAKIRIAELANSRQDFEPFSRVVMTNEIPIPPLVSRKLLKSLYQEAVDLPPNQKGAAFEDFICLLLGQVNDFEIKERNFRTETQELDVVIQVRRISEMSWQLSVPYILVEAKNRLEKTDQQDLNAFMSKVQSKGGSCRLGLMFSTSGFTSSAKMEELRYSRGNERIALLGPEEINALIESLTITETLDNQVRVALLR